MMTMLAQSILSTVGNTAGPPDNACAQRIGERRRAASLPAPLPKQSQLVYNTRRAQTALRMLPPDMPIRAAQTAARASVDSNEPHPCIMHGRGNELQTINQVRNQP